MNENNTLIRQKYLRDPEFSKFIDEKATEISSVLEEEIKYIARDLALGFTCTLVFNNGLIWVDPDSLEFGGETGDFLQRKQKENFSLLLDQIKKSI